MTNSRELQRLFRINTIKATLAEAEKQGREVDEAKMLLEIMVQFTVTRRTAVEYLEIARFKNNAKQEEYPLDKNIPQGSGQREENSQSGEG